MFIGICLLAAFACAWCIFGLVAARAPRWVLGLPALISAVLIWLGSHAELAHSPPGMSARIGRTVGVWSAIEGVAIFVAIGAAIRFNRRALIAPVVAIIVGLHFLPLAYAMPFPAYYLTGTALILIGVAGCWLGEAQSRAFVGIAAAMALWATAALVLARIA
jgi:hypothetical protein